MLMFHAKNYYHKGHTLGRGTQLCQLVAPELLQLQKRAWSLLKERLKGFQKLTNIIPIGLEIRIKHFMSKYEKKCFFIVVEQIDLFDL